MENDLTEVLNDKAFDVIEKDKKHNIIDFIEKLNGMSFDDAINELIAFYENMPFDSITESERNAMISAVLTRMPESEQKKINTILSSLFGS